MRLNSLSPGTGAALLIACGMMLASGLPRAPDLPPGPWQVRATRSVIATRDGPYRILVWRPEGKTGRRPLILYAPGWGIVARPDRVNWPIWPAMAMWR
jgi:hypothetical protein